MSAKPWIVLPLVLPVGEKEYTVLPVEYTDGLTLVAAQQGKSKILSAKTEDAELFKLTMGPAWDQMMDDHQPFNVMFRAGMAATQFQLAMISGLENSEALAYAEKTWETGMLPEDVAAQLAADTTAANRATRRAAAKKTAPATKAVTTTPAKKAPRKRPARKSVRPTTSTSTASANATPSPASTRTTTSRPTTPRTAATAPSPPPGPPSPGSGP